MTLNCQCYKNLPFRDGPQVKKVCDAHEAPQVKKVCYTQDVQHVKKGCDAHDCGISPRTEHGPTSLYISR